MKGGGFVLGAWIVTILTIAGCADRSTLDRTDDADETRGAKFASGTVGNAVSSVPLTMERVRTWYAVAEDMTAMVHSGRAESMQFEFPLSSSMQSHLDNITRNKDLARSLADHGLSPTDFVALTVLIGSGWMALQLRDSLGPSAIPANVDPELLTFFLTHRVELDSLSRMSAHEP